MDLDTTIHDRALAAAAHRDQATAQRRRNLRYAEEVRNALARLKDEVHADPSWLLLVGLVGGELERPHAGRVRIGYLLTATPGIGTVKARTILHAAGVGTPRRRLEELTTRQRDALAAELLRQRRRLTTAALERFASTPRHWTRSP